jgi:hypothetical protein
MFTCPQNLTYSFFTIYKTITFKVEEIYFFPLPKGYSSVLEAKKTTFSSRYGMRKFVSLFVSGLGTCPQKLILIWDVEPCENNHFVEEGMLKFTYKGRFLTI